MFHGQCTRSRALESEVAFLVRHGDGIGQFGRTHPPLDSEYTGSGWQGILDGQQFTGTLELQAVKGIGIGNNEDRRLGEGRSAHLVGGIEGHIIITGGQILIGRFRVSVNSLVVDEDNMRFAVGDFPGPTGGFVAALIFKEYGLALHHAIGLYLEGYGRCNIACSHFLGNLLGAGLTGNLQCHIILTNLFIDCTCIDRCHFLYFGSRHAPFIGKTLALGTVNETEVVAHRQVGFHYIKVSDNIFLTERQNFYRSG